MKPNKFGSDKNPFAKVVKKAKGGATTAFGKAFAAARERGDKEFTFEGRGKNTRFTTETVEEQAARKANKTSGPTPEAIKPKKNSPADTSKDNAKLDSLLTAEERSKIKPDFNSMLMRGSDTGPMASGYKLPAKRPITATSRDTFTPRPVSPSRTPKLRAVVPPAPVDEDTQAAIDRFTAGRGSVSPLRGNANPGVSPGYAKGGESKAMMKKEVAFMKKKGAPKSMVKHETAEMKMAKGGAFRSSANGIAKKGKTKAAMPKMAKGGSIDGIAMRGKTRGCK